MCQTEAETEHLWNMEPYGTSGGPVAGVPSTCSRTWRSTACWNSCISAAPGGVETVELLLHVATTCKNMGCFWSCWTVLNSSYGCGSFILCCSKFPSRCSVSLQSFDLLVLPWILEQPQWLQNFLLQLLQNHLMALFIWSFFCSLLRFLMLQSRAHFRTQYKHASNTLQFTIYARMLQPPKIGIGATWLKPVRAEV